MNTIEQAKYDLAWARWVPPVPKIWQDKIDVSKLPANPTSNFAYDDVKVQNLPKVPRPDKPLVAVKKIRRDSGTVELEKRKKADLLAKKRMLREAFYASRKKREVLR